MPRVRGTRALVATLPNGRTVWLRIGAAPVSVRELDGLAGTIDRIDARHVRALRANAATARRHAQTLKNDTARLSRRRLRDDRKLRRRILAGDVKLDRRAASLQRIGRKAGLERKKQLTLLRGRGRRDLLDQLVIVSAAPLLAAYGQRSDPLAANNLVIALALGVWLVGDEVMDLLAGKRTFKAGPIRGSDAWSYLAPVANLLTGWWLLDDQQHERFVTGITGLQDFEVFTEPPESVHLLAGNSENTSDDIMLEVASSAEQRLIGQRALYVATVDLSTLVGREHLADFQTFTKVPALATLRVVEFASEVVEEADSPQIELLMAEVKQGILWLSVRVSAVLSLGTSPQPPQLPPLLNRLEVAWAVDTQEPSA
ncbi:MAG: hypothetical protein PVG22_05305 [Chromatiales bacterium]